MDVPFHEWNDPNVVYARGLEERRPLGVYHGESINQVNPQDYEKLPPHMDRQGEYYDALRQLQTDQLHRSFTNVDAAAVLRRHAGSVAGIGPREADEAAARIHAARVRLEESKARERESLERLNEKLRLQRERQQRREEQLQTAEDTLHRSTILARCLVLTDTPFDEGLGGWRIGYRIISQSGNGIHAEGQYMSISGAIVGFVEFWDVVPHDTSSFLTNHRIEVTTPEMREPQELADFYEGDVTKLNAGLGLLAERRGIEPARLRNWRAADLGKYQAETAEIFAERRDYRLWLDSGADRHAGKVHGWRTKIVAGIMALGAIIGGALAVNANRAVPISAQEFTEAENDFLAGRIHKKASGQIEREVSDGNRAGFVVEQCPAYVMESYDRERGVRKAACELVAVEVPDGVWLELDVGGAYSPAVR